MLTRQTLAGQVYEHLRKKITNVELQPGSRIDVHQIAKELGVSITPVREAISKLSEQGLVVVKPYVGFFVVNITAKDIEELFDLRKSLELLGLEYVMRSPDTDLIQQLLWKAETILTKTGEELANAIREFDEEFHLNFLIKSSGNKWLTRVANGVIDLIKMTTRMTLNPYAASREHKTIVESMLTLDMEAAKSALVSHLDRAKNEAIHIVSK